MVNIRWTIGGDVSIDGWNCLRQSISSFIQVYGKDFGFHVYVNGRPKMNLELPVNIKLCEDKLLQGTGSVWKLTDRVDITNNELWLDNDIVFFRKNGCVMDFFNGNKCIIAEDSLRNYGRFDSFINYKTPLNAGIMGLAAGFDFCGMVQKQCSLVAGSLTSSDEQGLSVLTMLIENPNIIPFDEIPVVLPWGIPHTQWGLFKEYQWNSDAVHFAGLNRKKHFYYDKYRIKL